MEAAPIVIPGLQPRPGQPGIQFLGVPQFQEVGTRCTEHISGAIASNVSDDDAISACDAIASEVEGEEW